MFDVSAFAKATAGQVKFDGARWFHHLKKRTPVTK